MKHQHQTPAHKTEEVLSNRCYKLWDHHILISVRGKSGNNDLPGERLRGVIINSGDSEGLGGWGHRILWTFPMALSSPDCLSTMGDHISGQTSSVHPSPLKWVWRIGSKWGGDILKYLPPCVAVFSVAVGCVSWRLIKRSVSCGVTPADRRQATDRATQKSDELQHF